MIAFIVRRTLIGITTLVFISIISFVVIQLPEGDWLDTWQGATEGSSGFDIIVTAEEVERLRAIYGLDQPLWRQYLTWAKNLSTGTLGFSLDYKIPVATVIRDRMVLTVALAGFTVLFTWLLAIPIGIYSAVRQYSIGDYAFTFLGFLGLAIPDFLLALVLMYFAFALFDQNVGGLFSPDYLDAPWSVGRAIDLLKPPLDTSSGSGYVGHSRPHQDHEGQRPRRDIQALRRHRAGKGDVGVANNPEVPG